MKHRLGTLIEGLSTGNEKVFGRIFAARIDNMGVTYEVSTREKPDQFEFVKEDRIEQVYYPQRKSKPRKKKELAHGTES